jgi:hypothetical protein
MNINTVKWQLTLLKLSRSADVYGVKKVLYSETPDRVKTFQFANYYIYNIVCIILIIIIIIYAFHPVVYDNIVL